MTDKMLFVGTDPRANYVEQVMALVEEGKLKPGDVSVIDVYHDDDCAVFSGGVCDCDPEVRLRGEVIR